MHKYRVSKSHPRGDNVTISYPADAMSLALIKSAGGVSKLTEEQRARLKMKHVRPGDDCSDMPSESAKIYLERGWIEMIQHEPIPVVEEKNQEAKS